MMRILSYLLVIDDFEAFIYYTSYQIQFPGTGNPASSK